MNNIGLKTIAIAGALTLAGLIGGCQPGSVSKADFDTLRADVDRLVIAVEGDPRAVCSADNIMTLDQYSDTAPEANEDLDAWHAENGARDGVTTTESGLQYRVVQSGDADAPSPVGSQMVEVNYHGFFPDGEVFDSSYNRGEPIAFPANGVIRGWVEALAEMKPCEARILYIPGDLAYGASGRGGIPPNATLVFYVQLLEVQQKR